MQAPQTLQILTPKPLHLLIWTPNHWEMLANLTLRGLGLCDLCPSFIAEGLWFTTVNKWRWWTKASLNSSSVLVSRSFWRKVMSENIVAKVRPTSVAVLVLFWRGKKEKCKNLKLFPFTAGTQNEIFAPLGIIFQDSRTWAKSESSWACTSSPIPSSGLLKLNN